MIAKRKKELFVWITRAVFTEIIHLSFTFRPACQIHIVRFCFDCDWEKNIPSSFNCHSTWMRFFVCVCENLSRLASVSVSPYVHVIPHESHGANNEIWERDYGMKANLKRRSIRGVEWHSVSGYKASVCCDHVQCSIKTCQDKLKKGYSGRLCIGWSVVNTRTPNMESCRSKNVKTDAPHQKYTWGLEGAAIKTERKVEEFKLWNWRVKIGANKSPLCFV